MDAPILHARPHVLPQLRQLLRVRQPGSYYVYDHPAALQKTIMNVSSVTAPERIGLSLRFYHFPATRASFFSGVSLNQFQLLNALIRPFKRALYKSINPISELIRCGQSILVIWCLYILAEVLFMQQLMYERGKLELVNYF